VNNFLTPIQVRLSPNLVSHTLGTGDEVIKFWKVTVKGQGRCTGKICALVKALLVSSFFFNKVPPTLCVGGPFSERRSSNSRV